MTEREIDGIASAVCFMRSLRTPRIATSLVLWHSAFIDGLVVGSMPMTAYKLLNSMVPLVEEASAIRSQCWRGLQRVRGCLDDDGRPTPRAIVSVLAGDFLLKPFRFCTTLSSPLSRTAFLRQLESKSCV